MAAEAGGGNRRGLVVGVVLIIATVFFVWGSFAERSGHHDVHSSVPSGESAANGESAAQHAAEGGGGSDGTASAGVASETAEYRPLGVNLESTPLVIGGAMLSVLLAALVIARSRREVLIVAALLALAFTTLEVAEVAHQIDANKTGLVVLALLAGVLHALTAGLAIGVLFAKPTPVP